MKWTWENFGIFIEPDRPEPEKLEPATDLVAHFDPATESAALDAVVPEVTTLESAAVESAALKSAALESAALKSEANELKTIQSLAPMSAGSQRVRRILRECLHLRDAVRLEIQFYEATGKCAVIVQAQEANPTWQEVLDASRRSGWEVEVFAAPQFERLKRSAIQDFARIQAITPGLAQTLVNHGLFTLQELAAMDVKVLVRLSGLDRTQAKAVMQQAEFHAEQMEF